MGLVVDAGNLINLLRLELAESKQERENEKNVMVNTAFGILMNAFGHKQ